MIEILITIIFSTVKFAMTFPLAIMQFQFNFMETILWTNVGGIIGIALTTPFLLSIPVGTFLVVRYYRTSKTRFLYLIASNLLWSLIYAGFYFFWDILIFKQV